MADQIQAIARKQPVFAPHLASDASRKYEVHRFAGNERRVAAGLCQDNFEHLSQREECGKLLPASFI